MYTLIMLYSGYFIYLAIFFRCKSKDRIYKKVTIILAVKLVILTILYLMFFSDKMTKEERIENLGKIFSSEEKEKNEN